MFLQVSHVKWCEAPGVLRRRLQGFGVRWGHLWSPKHELMEDDPPPPPVMSYDWNGESLMIGYDC